MKASRGEKGIERKRDRSFQPLIMTLACLFFISLFLGFAIVNYKRIEMTLIQVQANKATSILDGIERVAQQYFSSIERMVERSTDLDNSTGLDTNGFMIQEALVEAIIKKAQEMDNEEKEGNLNPGSIARVAMEAKITVIAFLNLEGKVIMGNRSVPSRISEEIRRFLLEGKDVVIRLFNQSEANGLPGYVALRRQGKAGIVLLVLERENLLQWAIDISLQEALNAVGWRKGIVYEELEDSHGSTSARAGEVWEGEEIRYLPAFYVKTDRGETTVRRLKRNDLNVIEIILPFKIAGSTFGKARIGLDPGEMDSILAKNRIYIIISTAMIASLGILAVVFLYTSQVHHHKRLQEIRERLNQSERLAALWRLAGVVAHEVRNPLNSISMAIQRIGREYAPKEVTLKEEFYRITSTVRDEIKRIDRIVQDFLGMSSPGKLKIQPISIPSLMERLQTLVESEAESRSIKIFISEDGKVPSVLIDPDRTLQALLNILKNAMEAIPDSGGSISISIMEKRVGRVTIEISDTGKGMEPEEVDRIFDPGYTTKEKGLGLGLAIAHEIIKMQGGEIDVKSQRGKGTTFSISFPVLKEKEARDLDHEET